MRAAILSVLLLASCDAATDPPAPREARTPPAQSQSAMPAAAARSSTVLPIPKQEAQLKRLLAMGYKVHEDHLDPPGVASCPKMAENPVM